MRGITTVVRFFQFSCGVLVGVLKARVVCVPHGLLMLTAYDSAWPDGFSTAVGMYHGGLFCGVCGTHIYGYIYKDRMVYSCQIAST